MCVLQVLLWVKKVIHTTYKLKRSGHCADQVGRGEHFSEEETV